MFQGRLKAASDKKKADEEANQKALEDAARRLAAEEDAKARALKKMRIPDVVITEKDGCLLWEVHLRKRGGMMKFGFAFNCGKGEFLRDRFRRIGISKDKIATGGDGAATKDPNFALPGMPLEAAENYLSQAGLLGAGAADTRAPEVLRIRKISEGDLLDEWCLDYPEADVRLFDRISSVNGMSTVDEMKAELSKSNELVMQVVRYPEVFTVELEKQEGSKLGFRFEKPGGDDALQDLRITEVSEKGLLNEANEKNIAQGLFHMVVMAGMCIVAVNKVGGSDAELAEALRKLPLGTIQLEIKRGEADQIATKESNIMKTTGNLQLFNPLTQHR